MNKKTESRYAGASCAATRNLDDQIRYNPSLMPPSFQPLSALDPELLVEYLGREEFPADIVRWKYFDARFNRDRERGYAWVKDGKIGGFLGLIPFQVVLNGRVADAAWTCDWSVQDQTAKGVGILLIRQAQNRYEFLTQLGGNDATQRIVSRLSSMTENEAGVVYHLPLRVGAALRVVRRKKPKLPVDAIEVVNRIPVRWPRRVSSDAVRFEPGVSEKLSCVSRARAAQRFLCSLRLSVFEMADHRFAAPQGGNLFRRRGLGASRRRADLAREAA